MRNRECRSADRDLAEHWDDQFVLQYSLTCHTAVTPLPVRTPIK